MMEPKQEPRAGPQSLAVREVIALHPGPGVALHGPSTLWRLEGGRADVHAELCSEAGTVLRREHLLTVEPGQTVFAFPSHRPNVRLVASGCGGSLGSGRNQAVLSPTETGLDEGVGFAGSIVGTDDWLERWMRALARLAPDVDFVDQILAPGDRAELAVDHRAAAAQGIVWVQLEAAASLLDQVEIDVGVEPLFLPLSTEVWVTARAAMTLEGVSTEALSRQSVWRQGIETFHRLSFDVLHRHLVTAQRDEHDRLEAKAQQLVRDHSRVLTRFQAVFDHKADRGVPEGGASPLAMACERIGEALGVRVEHPKAMGTRERSVTSQIEEIAGRSRLRTRQVLLRHGWWRQESGPMLAFRRDSGEPVALLSSRRGKVPLWSAGANESVMVSEESASEIDPVAYSFYRTLPDHSLGAVDLLRFSSEAGRREVLAALLFGALGTLMAMVVPIATGLIVDVSIPTHQSLQLFSIVGGLAVAAIAGFCFRVCENISILRLKGNVKRALEPALLDRLLRMPSKFFRRFAPGDLAYRTMTIALIQSQLTGEVFSTLLAGLFSLLNFAVLVTLQPAAAVVALMIMLGLSLSSIWVVYRQQAGLASTQRLRGRLGSLALQMVAGMRRVRLTGAEGRFFVRWGHLFMELREAFFDAYLARVRFAAFSTGYQILAFALIFGALAWLDDGSLTTGGTLAFLAAFTLMMTGFDRMTKTLVELADLVPMYRRVQPLLTSCPEGAAERVHPGILAGRIEVNEVFFRYGADTPRVLRGASLQVEPGESVAIVGASGCGKSTLLRLILGFERPTAGSIYFDGKDLASLDPRAVRQQIGVVLQQDKLMEATIFDNIRGASEISLEDAWHAARMSSIAAEIDAMPLGMHTVISADGSDLSGGQAQRLLIARALAGRPRILLLDEATSALDNKAQATVVESLERLRVTRVAIAHRLSTVEKADRIFVLDQGRVAESGRFEDLMAKNGIFADLVRRQLA